MTSTGFIWDEKCFWHYGSGYAQTAPLGGLVQPMAAGGLPEDPETKRRFKNLLDVTGLSRELSCHSAPPATREDLERIHPASYLDQFKALSDMRGGEISPDDRVPFGAGGYEVAALSAGLVKGALLSVLSGEYRNAYALSRPPGHHCLPDRPNGFCLLANIAIAIEAAIAAGHRLRYAVVDWDVHHGNGTEAIFYDRDDVLTISIHQERNYPWDTGDIDAQGRDAGQGTNMNIPLPPGAGHDTYIDAMDRLVIPKLRGFQPDVIIVACGFDASGLDTLSRMLCGAETFKAMTLQLMNAAAEICGDRLVMAHEGGYSEVHVPFCGHGVMEALSGVDIRALDAFGPRLANQQPNEDMLAIYAGLIDRYVEYFGL